MHDSPALLIRAKNLEEIQEALQQARVSSTRVHNADAGSPSSAAPSGLESSADQALFLLVPFRQPSRGYVLDSIKRAVWVKAPDGQTQSVRLTPKEFEILDALDRGGGKLDRDRLFQAVWSDAVVGKKTLDVHLFSLRQKLEKLGLEVRWVDGLYRLQQKDI